MDVASNQCDTYTWSGVVFFSQERQIGFESEFKTQANFCNVAQFCFNPSIVYDPSELSNQLHKDISNYFRVLFVE